MADLLEVYAVSSNSVLNTSRVCCHTGTWLPYSAYLSRPWLVLEKAVTAFDASKCCMSAFEGVVHIYTYEQPRSQHNLYRHRSHCTVAGRRRAPPVVPILLPFLLGGNGGTGV